MLALHQAVEFMDENAVHDLLKAGADPNEPDPELDGFRPLHVAIDIECENSCYRYDMGEVEASPKATISRILLEAGADPDLPDFRGKTARSIAMERMHTEALRLFRDI